MPNNYYNYNNDLLPGTKTRSQEIDEQFAAIEAAFDLLADSDDLTVGANLGGIDSGLADAYDVNTGGTSTLVDLQLVTFVPLETNTGASTLTYNGSSNFPIVRNDGTPVQEGDLIQGVPTMLLWDGTNSRWVHVGATAFQAAQNTRPSIIVVSASRDLAATDEQAILVCNTTGGAITLTVLANATLELPIGFIVHFYASGANDVIVAGAGGVTINFSIGTQTRAQYSSLSLVKTATDTWFLLGDQGA